MYKRQTANTGPTTPSSVGGPVTFSGLGIIIITITAIGEALRAGDVFETVTATNPDIRYLLGARTAVLFAQSIARPRSSAVKASSIRRRPMTTESVDRPSTETVKIRQGTGPRAMVSVLLAGLTAALVAGLVLVGYVVLVY